MSVKHSLRVSLLATVALTLPLSALAQSFEETPYQLDEIIISGSLTPVPASKTGATVEKLDAAAIPDAAVPALTLLDRLPGLSYSSNGGIGSSSSLRIRGLPSAYVATRINGIDVTDMTGNKIAYDFNGLIGFGISSIEVVKGSQSALYGSEAVAGLIDIRTDNAVAPGYNTTVELTAGSDNTYAAGLSTKMESDSGMLYFNLSHMKTDGFTNRPGNDEKDGFEGTNLTFGLEQDLSDVVTVGLTGLYMTSEADFDRSATAPSGYTTNDSKGLRAYTRFDTGMVQHEIGVSLFDIDRSDPLAPVGYTRDFSGKRRSVDYLGSAELSAASTLSFGLEYTEEDFTLNDLQAGGSLTETKGGDDTFSAKAEWLLAPMDTLDLSVALRYDDHSDFGDHISGRLAAAWEVAPDWTLRAVLGTGFRAPSLYERYSSYGKEDLKEETSQSAELGLERRFSDTDFLKGTLFYTEIEDRIDYDFATSTYNQVKGTTTSKGVELSGQYAFSDRISLFGNYTYTDAKTAGARAERVPRHDLVVGIDALLNDRISGQFTVQYVADVVPSAYAPADHKVGDYTLVNAGMTYKLNDATALSLRIENLTDEDYETAGGYNTPGRSAYLGLKASF
ncbi:hypothetical protein CEW89_17190 [Celeribacter ethanolicus]|uniref:TonB-dependent receptor n=1 Tax=Celeribacter ethanolicus TaxID=1758178 RepID=A0A291GGD7_9RHOB|nr:TonB-dependent receptor [Celeribacter ethanolicus]ATG49150.1 hypothetical protein CEW89_17190 [Celeribacter ethanolicus]